MMGKVIKKITHPHSGRHTKRPKYNSSAIILAIFAVCALFGIFSLVGVKKGNNAVENNATTVMENKLEAIHGVTKKEGKTVTLSTSQGDIIISLRPNLSPDSVKYIQALIDSPAPCANCNFYRAEQRGILQGILEKDSVPPNLVLGDCPLSPEEEAEMKKKEEDAMCHGPEMTRGMVGWAAGEGGPDFFIDNYEKPADWWGHDHTVWGEIVDEKSLGVVDSFFDLPVHEDVLMYLDDEVPIQLIQK